MSVVPSRQNATCPVCSRARVRRRARAGRTIPYKAVAILPVPADLALPTCGACGHEWFDEAAQAELSDRIEDAYRAALRCRVRQAIRMITEFTSQRRIERLLGLSQGYLSRLLAGAGTPSSELCSTMALIARDPPARLRELERYWSDLDGAHALRTASPLRG